MDINDKIHKVELSKNTWTLIDTEVINTEIDIIHIQHLITRREFINAICQQQKLI